MKLKVTRYSLQIVPETSYDNSDERDTAFIEDVLGLEKNGDWIKLKRVNASGLSCIAYLETEGDSKEDSGK